jgi:DNA (cytosine-5)-methyltransferase 1
MTVEPQMSPRLDLDLEYLKTKVKPSPTLWSGSVRVVDLFCGCGGLSLGCMEASHALGKRFDPVLAIDNDPDALLVYDANFHPNRAYCLDLSKLFSGKLGSGATGTELGLTKSLGPVDVLLAGPPCQGHSDLNNHTRRNDPRNRLYQRVGRFVELVQPKHVLVENVPGVLHDKRASFHQTKKLISSLGYETDDGIVDLSVLGVPQRRKRHVLVASRSKKPLIQDIIEKHRVPVPRTVSWAISDLETINGQGILDSSSKHTGENGKRIGYLHANQVFDLPDRLRPECHQSGDHSYRSSYGRMKPDEPAQTITGGFLSPGQGRFVHPNCSRTITPHEAARLQFFPDFFDFSVATSRASIASMIGNAAPMKLSYAFCLEMMR